MYTRSKKESPRRERNGLAFHIPLQRGDLSDVGLTAFWVDVARGLSRGLTNTPRRRCT